MHQEAADVPILCELVEHLTYKPSWQIWLEENADRGQGSVGLTLMIQAVVRDSNPPHKETAVRHLFPVPPAAYNRRSWQHWLLEQLILVERHEACEFFKINGSRPYAPAHGPGNDPYLVLEQGTIEDATTTFRGARVLH